MSQQIQYQTVVGAAERVEVQNCTTGNLDYLVADAIKDDWRPIGGVAVFRLGSGPIRFYQAMIRENRK